MSIRYLVSKDFTIMGKDVIIHQKWLRTYAHEIGYVG